MIHPRGGIGCVEPVVSQASGTTHSDTKLRSNRHVLLAVFLLELHFSDLSALKLRA